MVYYIAQFVYCTSLPYIFFAYEHATVLIIQSAEQYVE